MSDQVGAPLAADESASGRSDRVALLAFAADADTESVLREVLLEMLPNGIEVRRGGIRAAIAVLQKMPTPKALIVDISGEDQPLVLLSDLSQVVEPAVRVLVIGDRNDVAFYREVTRGLGAMEYLFKPLSGDMVARYFGPLIIRQARPLASVQGGSVVSVTGVRGGVGATTIAAHLAWHFGVASTRHTVLLDLDLQRGSAAMLLDAKTSPGLRAALENPQRIDELFVERATQPVAGRLSVLAGEEPVADQPNPAPGAADRLLQALRRQYNLVVADVPLMPLQLNRDVLDLAKRRVLVLTPTLVGVRDTLRLLTLPSGPMQARRAVVVLNRVGMVGGLSRKQVEDALKMRADIAIPDLPRRLGSAATMGRPGAAMRGGFANALKALAQELAAVSVNGNPLAEAAEPPRRRRLFG